MTLGVGLGLILSPYSGTELAISLDQAEMFGEWLRLPGSVFLNLTQMVVVPLITSLTTIVGLIPLAISNPMWRPLCYAVIFGQIASTVLTLIVVPCLYVFLTKEPREKAI